MQATLQKEIETVSRISAVKMILRTLSRATKMRISLVSRITDDSWTACSVIDEANFGLNAGDQLDLETTY